MAGENGATFENSPTATFFCCAGGIELLLDILKLWTKDEVECMVVVVDEEVSDIDRAATTCCSQHHPLPTAQVMMRAAVRALTPLAKDKGDEAQHILELNGRAVMDEIMDVHR